jgi:hypothetical protein
MCLTSLDGFACRGAGERVVHRDWKRLPRQRHPERLVARAAREAAPRSTAARVKSLAEN